MNFANSTDLSTPRLEQVFEEALAPWSVGEFTVRVRFSRGADFSGTCIYVDRLIYVNLGRHLRYPYLMQTNLARVKTALRGWRRDLYTLELADGCQLAVFIFMHELYHLLVYRAGRNTRQKESMCDRFAARHLVDRFGCVIRSADGQRVPREAWDFQDLDGFVTARRVRRVVRSKSAVSARNLRTSNFELRA